MIEKIKRLIPKKIFKFIQPLYHFFLSLLAAVIYRFPSHRLVVIGVTGTAGKTSSVYLIAKILNQAGHKTGFTSTTVFSNGDHEVLNDKKMTMPGRFFIQKSLRQMLKNNCRFAVIETTSEGIKQFRHRFINYDILLFTGLYPEHIESHGSFEKYKATKGKLFAYLGRFKNKYLNQDYVVCSQKTGLKTLNLTRVAKTIVVNSDDAEAAYFLNFWSDQKIAFHLYNNLTEEFSDNNNILKQNLNIDNWQQIRGELVSTGAHGSELKINEMIIKLKLLGEFNARNALAAYSIGLVLQLKPEEIKIGLESLESLAGKMELISAGQDFIVMVDYSFEPRALEKLYQVIALFSYQRLIHVLGSTGGGRDQSRRVILGKMAGKMADIVIVTNEDPYDEEPMDIIDQVAAGAQAVGKVEEKDLFIILDRREALKKAVELAEANDLVLATGKGSEQYICVAQGQKIPWDERKELRKAIVDKLCIDK